MGIDRTLTVRPGNFAGNSKVYSSGPEGLAAQVRQLQASNAALTLGALGIDWSSADSSALEGATVVTAADFANDNLLLVNGSLQVPSGHPVVISGGDVPDGLVTATEYFIVRVQGSGQAGTKDESVFKLAATQKEAENGEFITLVDAGSGVIRIELQVALPTALISFDGTGGTLAVGEAQFNVNADSILDCLASVVNLCNISRAVLGMPEPGVGTLTGSVATVAAVDLTSVANGDNDDALLFEDAQVIEQEINDAIMSVALNVNDLAAAVGLDEHLDFLSPHKGEETSDGSITDSTTASTGNVGGAATSVELTELDLKLTVWGAAVGQILHRVSVISAAAQNEDDFAVQVLPVNGTGGAPNVGSGLRSRQR